MRERDEAVMILTKNRLIHLPVIIQEEKATVAGEMTAIEKKKL
jgi:hypothetical protein